MKIDRKLKARLKGQLIKKMKEEERSLVVIETAYKLGKSDEQAFLKYYPEFKKNRVEFLANRELIGGFVIKHGSQIIDASVKTRLDDLVSQVLV